MSDYYPVVRVNETVDASPSEVWDTVTHKTGVMFMGADVKTDWQEGNPITFKGAWKGKTFEDRGKVEVFDKEKELAFTHFSSMAGKEDKPENYNLVSIELQPRGSATNVTLTQSVHRLADEPTPATVAEFEKNWRTMLAKLKDEAEQAASR